MTDEWGIAKELPKRRQSLKRCRPAICLEGFRKTIKILSHYGRLPRRHSNRALLNTFLGCHLETWTIFFSLPNPSGHTRPWSSLSLQQKLVACRLPPPFTRKASIFCCFSLEGWTPQSARTHTHKFNSCAAEYSNNSLHKRLWSPVDIKS
jgi:hypothetical protein